MLPDLVARRALGYSGGVNQLLIPPCLDFEVRVPYTNLAYLLTIRLHNFLLELATTKQLGQTHAITALATRARLKIFY